MKKQDKFNKQMKEQGFTKEKMTTKEISDALGLFEEVTKEFIDYISQSTSKEKRE